MSLNEVSAAVSVLLGFAPPASLPARSSAQVICTSCWNQLSLHASCDFTWTLQPLLSSFSVKQSASS
jgi:hypothetical protein